MYKMLISIRYYVLYTYIISRRKKDFHKLAAETGANLGLFPNFLQLIR